MRSDVANFINFCDGQVLTNGLQNAEGSCNGVGELPSINMTPHHLIPHSNG